ncbi:MULTISPECIES: cytochrome b5 domain-containing protein [Methanothermobacter]|nr:MULTISPECIES: cytochrome b5 domain-containing protein [Methanothermobacter]
MKRLGGGMREFTPDDLRKFDGISGPAYVACDGIVYDVSESFLWRDGRHQVIHRAGGDLTHELEKAPHGRELLERFPVVGTLKVK